MEPKTVERQNELEDIAKIMRTRGGRRFMWRVLEGAGIFHSSFHTDALMMAFNEGRRNQGLILLADIMEIDADNYILMTKEAKTRQEAKELDDERNRANSES